MSHEKLCVFCKHIDMNTRGCYGDYPDPAMFECEKGHWEVSEFDIKTEFRQVILKAANCKDYREAR